MVAHVRTARAAADVSTVIVVDEGKIDIVIF
jgi:hypothetical protein